MHNKHSFESVVSVYKLNIIIDLLTVEVVEVDVASIVEVVVTEALGVASEVEDLGVANEVE